MAKSNSSKLSPWAKDERGKKYGKLTVIAFAGTRGEVIWTCRCECGNLAKVAGSDLRKGGTKSCGCGRATQNGGSKTTEYCSWKEMKRRCYNTKHIEYKNYGGRGIEICSRWRTSFVNFLADMGNKPFPEATIDRINNDGNYEPGNCRWATKMEQGQNTRKTVMLTHDGKTQCIREWARELGVQHCVIRYRIKHCWPIEKVLSKRAAILGGI
jgi:hypothetical protein